MDKRTTATVLAALRYFQPKVEKDVNGNDAIPFSLKDHFEDHEPLSKEEIDALCEAINLGDFDKDDSFATFTRADVEEKQRALFEDDEATPRLLTEQEIDRAWDSLKRNIQSNESFMQTMWEAIHEEIVDIVGGTDEEESEEDDED